jgi:putative flavoprotein involved in K+ transport
VRGVTAVPGAYFVGLPWLYTWGSGRFSGVARDAEYLAEHIKAQIRLSGSERQEAMVNEAAIGS